MKKKFLKITSVTVILCLMIVAFSSCSVKKYYEGAPDGMRPVCDGSEGAILYVPESWQVDTSTGIPTAYYSSNDRSTVSLVRVAASELGGNDAKTYWESYKTTFASTLTDFAVSKESETEKDYTTRLIGNAAAYVFDFTAKVTGIDFKFRQALLNDPSNGDLFIITYSAQAAVFDNHTEALTEIYDNFKFVSEVTEMADKTEIRLPDAEGTEVPEGYMLLSGEFVDYVLFVPDNWIPLVTTGLSAACSPENKDTTVNAMAFTTTNGSIDSYWEDYENDLKNTYGNLTYKNGDTKYSEIKLDGFDVRKYSYEINVSGTAYTYDQYVHINGGYVIILTCSCKTSDYGTVSDTFDSIVSHFKYK